MSGNRAPERRQLTVMLCDLVGWSALSMRLDAEELAERIEGYRRRCAEIVAKHGGMVAQYAGDAILAYFGYPYAHEDDAERAIRAALEMAATEQDQRLADHDVHIGIATGIVVVGNLATHRAPLPGSEVFNPTWDDTSAVGSAPNLAARLQALAGPRTVIVSEETRRLSRGIFDYTDLGVQKLKGFDEPMRAWQVLGESAVPSRFHALRAPGLTPLVDRQPEREHLRQLWDAARHGEGRAVLIHADAGVGKSRLAHVVATEIVDTPCMRIWFYCSPNLQSSPLAPIVRQIVTGTGVTREDDDATKLAKLAAIVPPELRASNEAVTLLAHFLSIRGESHVTPVDVSPQRLRQRLFEALMQLLEAHARRQPVLLVVEDLHWIDPSSDEFIGMLIDRLAGMRMLVVLTARSEFQAHWDDRPHLVRMPLNTLERSDSIEMIRHLCGERTISGRTVDQIADKTDGLPLFIEDLTKDVLESVDFERPADAPAGASREPTFAIPSTLKDSLMSRLDRLGRAKSTAQTAAVIGREFAYDLLARVVDLDDAELKEDLQRLIASGLLVRRRSTVALTYAFKHALVRDTAYSTLLRRSQEATHLKIARLLSEHFPEIAEMQPEVPAYHFQAGRDVDNAVRHRVRAAKQAARRSGFVEAVVQLEGALTLLAGEPLTRERLRQELRVHLTLGGIYAEYRGFSSSACGEQYREALKLCREIGDAPEIFSVLSGVGSVAITRAEFETCRALAEECLTRAAAQSAEPPFVMGHLLRGGTSFLTGELAAARTDLEEALSRYAKDRGAERGRQVLYVQDQKSTALCYLGLTLTILGHLDEGLQAAESGLAHSQALGGQHTINFSLCYLAAVLHIRGDNREALRRATQSLELAREQQFATWVGVSQMIRGCALACDGRFDEGFAEIAAGVKAHGEMDALAYRPFGHALFAQGLLATGKLEEARCAVDEALAIVEKTGERFYLAELLRLRGEILAQSNDPAGAEHALRESIAVARRQEARLFELRSAISLCRIVEREQKEAVSREILEPIARWFDGVDASEVRDATALIAAGR